MSAGVAAEESIAVIPNVTGNVVSVVEHHPEETVQSRPESTFETQRNRKRVRTPREPKRREELKPRSTRVSKKTPLRYPEHRAGDKGMDREHLMRTLYVGLDTDVDFGIGPGAVSELSPSSKLPGSTSSRT